MKHNNLTDTQNILLEILSCSLKGKKYETTVKHDWEAIFKECKCQAVLLQTFDSIKTDIMKAELQQKWTMFAIGSLRNNLTINSHHAYLHRLMTENNISYCILKGCSSSYYYPNPNLRAMGDVDFLVNYTDVEKASEILKSNGFVSWNEEHECHIVFRKDKIHFELHFKPAGVPEGKAGELIKSYLSDIFETAYTVNIQNNYFIKPDDFHHGLVLLMHMYHHLLSEGIGLRHLCDWACFVNHFENLQFKKIFEARLVECGLWKFAQIISLTSHYFLDIPYYEWMGEKDYDLCESLISDILSGGNFGIKDKTRVKQGHAISNRGKDGIAKSGFIHTISYMNDMAYQNFKLVSKLRLLKPVGFIFWSIKYLYERITGKRSKIKIKVFSNANSRIKIYQNFHLFENSDKIIENKVEEK